MADGCGVVCPSVRRAGVPVGWRRPLQSRGGCLAHQSVTGRTVEQCPLFSGASQPGRPPAREDGFKCPVAEGRAQGEPVSISIRMVYFVIEALGYTPKMQKYGKYCDAKLAISMYCLSKKS